MCALPPLAHRQIPLSIVVINRIVCKRGFFVNNLKKKKKRNLFFWSRRSLCSESLEAYSRRMTLATIGMEIDLFGLTCALIAGKYNWYQFAPKCVCFIVYASRKQNRIKKWWGFYYHFSFSFYLFWFLKCDSSCGTVSSMWWSFFFSFMFIMFIALLI